MSETLSRFALQAGEPIEPDAQEAIAANRAIFDEQVRQQREILALQREAYNNLIETTRSEQANLMALLRELGLVALVRDDHLTTPRDDGFIF